MQIYRLSWSKYAREMTGEGAKIYGGRWNNIGTPCIYTSESRALAILEYAVNVNLESLPADLSLVTLDIPDGGHKIFSREQLPHHWNDKQVSAIPRHFSASFLKDAAYLIIKIPSVVVPQEFNFLINPMHKDMKKVTITDVSDFSFDRRLKK